jgi:hypothetical protein
VPHKLRDKPHWCNTQPTERRAVRRFAVPISVAVLFLLVALVPYHPSIVGEYWGPLWFLLTAPVSNLAEEFIGIGPDSNSLVFAVSAFCAAGWGFIAHLFCKLYRACTK